MNFKKKILVLALGISLTALVNAQSSSGSVFGAAGPGENVTIENLDTGTKRTITADSSGKYSFTQLPAGRYTVSAGEASKTVQVNSGVGAKVDLEGSLDEIVVVGKAQINPIDVSSVESSTIFTAEQIQRLPIARDITNVALLAPGTVKGDTGFGNLASFGGSSAGENGYYINGFDVTNIRNFTSYAALPYEGIGEQQIKTGGYGAEYGRSLGGVISLTTKRGTNEWQGGASFYWEPQGLRSEGKDVLSRDPTLGADERFFVYRSENTTTDSSLNAYVGGPIVQDRLFIFGLVQLTDDSTNIYRRSTSTRNTDKQPNGFVKVDWNISDNHLFEFTGIENTTKTKTQEYSNRTSASGDLLSAYSGEHETPSGPLKTTEAGGEVYIGKYTGYLTDNFTISAQYGRVNNTSDYVTPDPLPGGDCIVAYDSRANAAVTNYIGCWQEPFGSAASTRELGFGPNEDTRDAYRLDAEWRIGDHFLRFGYDAETFESTNAGLSYAGGAYYRYFLTGAAPRNVLGGQIPANTEYVRIRTRTTASGSYEVKNTAVYLEDNWQISDNLVGYLGVRSESFENLNGDGIKFVDAKDSIAPRLGLSWDVNGDSTLKVFGNAGRYFIPIASNTNIRASGWEESTEEFRLISGGINTATGLPGTLGARVGTLAVNGSRVAPDPRTVASQNLKPMFQDEFILGAQRAFDNDWTLGVKGIYRKVKNGFDDNCAHDPFFRWANDNNFNPDLVDTLAQCIIINPGEDVRIAVDVRADGNLQDVVIPARYFGLPKYKRDYKAVEFFWERNSEVWSLQGSYTWSKSQGNVEGYLNSTLEQDDAGLTQDFDFAIFEAGADGPLPNDRRHTLKTFGTYSLTPEWRLGGNALIQSGRPVNCTGFAPLDNPDYPLGIDDGSIPSYGASAFFCLDAAGNTVQSQRGDRGRTPWIYTFDASIQYIPAWANQQLDLKIDVFNIFNSSRVTEYSETGETVRGIQNLNFLNDQNYQTPRSVLFSVRYKF